MPHMSAPVIGKLYTQGTLCISSYFYLSFYFFRLPPMLLSQGENWSN
ncbi:hypothetical protein ALT721_2240002 [Alteromonas alvinellae]